MNAVIRKNLTDARAVDANDVDTAFDTSGAFGDGRDRVAVLPDDSDMHLGRERPLPTGPGTGSGGWQRGSLTPEMPPSLLLTAAPTAMRAANSAARCTAVKLLIAKNIVTSPAAALHVLLAPRLNTQPRTSRGTTAPESVFPPPFLRFRQLHQHPEDGELASGDSIAKPCRQFRERGTPRLRLADLHVHFHRSPCRVGQRFGEILGFQVGIRMRCSSIPRSKSAGAIRVTRMGGRPNDGTRVGRGTASHTSRGSCVPML